MNAFRRFLPGNLFRTIASARDDPEDGVHRHGDRRDDQRELEGVDRLRGRERVPGRAEAVLERLPEDDRERTDEDDREVGERDEAQPETGDHALHRSCLVANVRMKPIASSVANEIPRRTTATAAADAVSPLSMRP